MSKQIPSVAETVHDEISLTDELIQLPMSQTAVFSVLSPFRQSNMILVAETAYTMDDLARAWPTSNPESYFAFVLGGLGWDAPAAIGIALAQKHTGSKRPVVLVIGDGSSRHSVQSIYTAIQQKLRLIYLVPLNEGYVVLREFAALEDIPNLSGLAVPGLNVKSLAEAYGCTALRAESPGELKSCFLKALEGDAPCLIEFPASTRLQPLIKGIAGKVDKIESRRIGFNQAVYINADHGVNVTSNGYRTSMSSSRYRYSGMLAIGV